MRLAVGWLKLHLLSKRAAKVLAPPHLLAPFRSTRSNMDMPVSYAFNATAEIAASLAYPSLRLANELL